MVIYNLAMPGDSGRVSIGEMLQWIGIIKINDTYYI